MSYTIETKNAGPIILDPECVATFSKTGEVEDLLGNLELGDETLVEIYSLFSKYMQEPAKKEKTKPIAYKKDEVKVAKKEPAKQVMKICNIPRYDEPISVSILKTLAEQELPYANIVELHKVTSKVIGGSTENIDANEPRIPCILGGTKYTGLCDDVLSINIIPYSVYRDIQENLEYSKMEEVGMTILPFKRTTIIPKGIVRNVQVIVNNVIFQ